MTTAKWLFASLVLVLAACSSNNEEPPQKGTSANIGTIPTSANCASVGGVTTIAHNLNGDTLRMCQMPNGKQCEESALGFGACAG
ncbi:MULTISPECIES: putative hemolysin [unclassified Serratia (in: enterobacteria)]|uniref:putative hemolysin n=1 Tax=unclassified Serratia (in: enterobacteria) TaxID=2647522 RepID=UPI003075F8CF